MPYEVSWKNSRHGRSEIIYNIYTYIKIEYTIEILISDWKILRYVMEDAFNGIFTRNTFLVEDWQQNMKLHHKGKNILRGVTYYYNSRRNFYLKVEIKRELNLKKNLDKSNNVLSYLYGSTYTFSCYECLPLSMKRGIWLQSVL